jgi:hypothetical protein
MFGGFLQHLTLNMWHRGAFFYMPNSISTWSLKDLNISLNLICPKLFNFHTWYGIVWFTHEWEKFTWSCLCGSPFDLGARFANFFLRAKDLLNFQMCDSNYASQYWGIFENYVYKLFRIGLLYTNSSSFLLGPWPSQPPCLKWDYNVDCLKVRTWSSNDIQTRLLKPYIVHYLWKVAHGHVCVYKLFWKKNCKKKNKMLCYF